MLVLALMLALALALVLVLVLVLVRVLVLVLVLVLHCHRMGRAVGFNKRPTTIDYLAVELLAMSFTHISAFGQSASADVTSTTADKLLIASS